MYLPVDLFIYLLVDLFTSRFIYQIYLFIYK